MGMISRMSVTIESLLVAERVARWTVCSMESAREASVSVIQGGRERNAAHWMVESFTSFEIL